MTIDEKIEHLQLVAMEDARTQANAIIKEYQEGLDKLLHDQMEDAVRQSKLQLKTEIKKTQHELNKAMAKSQIELKRKQGKYQETLKQELFKEVCTLVDAYMKTNEYTLHLETCIEKAITFARGESMSIYINPSDVDKLSALETKMNTTLIVSNRDFQGGIRAVIHERNILIDYSFQSSLQEAYNDFLFQGGDHIA